MLHILPIYRIKKVAQSLYFSFVHLHEVAYYKLWCKEKTTRLVYQNRWQHRLQRCSFDSLKSHFCLGKPTADTVFKVKYNVTVDAQMVAWQNFCLSLTAVLVTS